MTPIQALGLAGPTASGKTALALAFAQAHQQATGQPVEIISVDSALVYRGMDIGTAKPSAEERAAVPHHLIDVLDPAERYSAALFVSDAQRLIAEIHARRHLPLLVGGTMLYFKALTDGLDPMPAADAAVRAAIDARAAVLGWPALHAELARVDASTAARLAPADAQRIQRALEVFELSGQPLSAWQRASDPPDLILPLVALEPDNRAWLHGRIEARFNAMLAAGLLAEVQTLRSRGDLHPGLPSMRCVGYRQAWEALDAGLGDQKFDAFDGVAKHHEHALHNFRNSCIAATRQLAKRQLTWLRSMPQRQSVACDAGDAQALGVAALQAAARQLQRHPGAG